MRTGKIYRLAGMLMAAMLISEGGAAAAGTLVPVTALNQANVSAMK